MKLYLGIDITPIAGYTNISPRGGEGIVEADFRNLNDIVEPNEAMEILAPDILDTIRRQDLKPFLEHLVSKLRHGGKLTIGGTDLMESCRAIISASHVKPHGKIDTSVANEILYGKQVDFWDYHRSVSSMKELSDILTSFGLKIIKKRTNALKMVVEAVRP